MQVQATVPDSGPSRGPDGGPDTGPDRPRRRTAVRAAPQAAGRTSGGRANLPPARQLCWLTRSPPVPPGGSDSPAVRTAYDSYTPAADHSHQQRRSVPMHSNLTVPLKQPPPSDTPLHSRRRWRRHVAGRGHRPASSHRPPPPGHAPRLARSCAETVRKARSKLEHKTALPAGRSAEGGRRRARPGGASRASGGGAGRHYQSGPVDGPSRTATTCGDASGRASWSLAWSRSGEGVREGSRERPTEREHESLPATQSPPGPASVAGCRGRVPEADEPFKINV